MKGEQRAQEGKARAAPERRQQPTLEEYIASRHKRRRTCAGQGGQVGRLQGLGQWANKEARQALFSLSGRPCKAGAFILKSGGTAAACCRCAQAAAAEAAGCGAETLLDTLYCVSALRRALVVQDSLRVFACAAEDIARLAIALGLRRGRASAGGGGGGGAGDGAAGGRSGGGTAGPHAEGAGASAGAHAEGSSPAAASSAASASHSVPASGSHTLVEELWHELLCTWGEPLPEGPAAAAVRALVRSDPLRQALVAAGEAKKAYALTMEELKQASGAPPSLPVE